MCTVEHGPCTHRRPRAGPPRRLQARPTYPESTAHTHTHTHNTRHDSKFGDRANQHHQMQITDHAPRYPSDRRSSTDSTRRPPFRATASPRRCQHACTHSRRANVRISSLASPPPQPRVAHFFALFRFLAEALRSASICLRRVSSSLRRNSFRRFFSSCHRGGARRHDERWVRRREHRDHAD